MKSCTASWTPPRKISTSTGSRLSAPSCFRWPRWPRPGAPVRQPYGAGRNVSTGRCEQGGQRSFGTNHRGAAIQGFRCFHAHQLCRGADAQRREVRGFPARRLRPEMRKAVEAWLQTDPFNDPKAPKDPFQMAEYVQTEEIEAKRQDAEAVRMKNAAPTGEADFRQVRSSNRAVRHGAVSRRHRRHVEFRLVEEDTQHPGLGLVHRHAVRFGVHASLQGMSAASGKSNQRTDEASVTLRAACGHCTRETTSLVSKRRMFP